MSFWGIEVKPGKPHPYHSDDVQGRLCITQATLGLGDSKERTVLQCSVGHKSPVFLCSLLPNKVESCSLNLEFKDELVAFSVVGPRSVHLCGYFVSDNGDNIGDEYDDEFDSGEEFASEEASDDDDSDEYDYCDDDVYASDDDDLGMFPPSPVPNSGVVIEEITDEDKAETEQMKKKKKKTSDLEAQKQIVPKSNAGASVFESEDEDGFPISSSHKSKAADQEPQADTGGKKGKVDAEKKKKQLGENSDAGKKRKMKKDDQDSQPERKTKKKQKEKLEEVNDHIKDESQPEIEKMQDTPDQRGEDMDTPKETSSEKKKKNKKKKKTQDVEGKSVDQTKSVVEDKAKSSVEADEKESESSNVRTFSNGLVIEELEMGKPDGKKANPGSQVSVKYIGKLKKTGKIFDSCIGKAPFKFRLGVGAVIKGWDVGVAGMRVGDKRRLTIPPSMGYGEKGAGGLIPPNAWVMFDVELVNVR